MLNVGCSTRLAAAAAATFVAASAYILWAWPFAVAWLRLGLLKNPRTQWRIQDLQTGGAKVERRRLEYRCAEGAEGVRCGEGASPSSLREGSGEGKFL